MTHPWRGIFVIVATPYTNGYEIDEASLRKHVHFCIDAGVSGLVGPAFASEFMMLSDEERMRWIEIVSGEAAGQVPVVGTTHAVHTVPAVKMSVRAQTLGVDGIMNMPPHMMHFNAAQSYTHYRTLSDALDIPVVIQNMVGPIGTPLANELLARMCRELPQVQYIKEETLPEPRQIARTIAVSGADCLGVFGGRNGHCIIDEFLRGACGNMPAAASPDIHARLWNHLEDGDIDSARRLFNQLLPMLTMPSQYGPGINAEILYRRGIFATNKSRMSAGELDDADRRALSAAMKGVL